MKNGDKKEALVNLERGEDLEEKIFCLRGMRLSSNRRAARKMPNLSASKEDFYKAE